MALSDYLFNSYDVPVELLANPSPAFEKFVVDVFVHSGRDGISARSLTQDELSRARQLVQRNLQLRFAHIIQAAGVLRDSDAAPALHDMLASETDLSRRLTIAASLWQIEQHPAFPTLLREMVESDDDTVKAAHAQDMSLLRDERAIHLLTDMANQPGGFAAHHALSLLNAIEHRTRFFRSTAALPHQADYYLARTEDSEFIAMMTRNMIEEPETGWPTHVDRSPARGARALLSRLFRR